MPTVQEMNPHAEVLQTPPDELWRAGEEQRVRDLAAAKEKSKGGKK